jgi:hypothetical protein
MRVSIFYYYDDIEYESQADVYAAIMEDHPELLGDDLHRFFDRNVEEYDNLDPYDDELEEGEDLDK